MPDHAPRHDHGLDANRRRPDGSLRASAIRHPEDFTRNTGENAYIERDEPPAPDDPDAAIIPSDSRGG